MVVSALRWIGGVDGYLELVDQRRLPGEFVRIECKGAEELFEAISTLAVRGAPAIGVAAGYGLVLGMRGVSDGDDLQEGVSRLERTAEYLSGSRPTAVNLFRALERVIKEARVFADEHGGEDCGALRRIVMAEANAICEEDIEMCRRIGENGEGFISEGAGVLTHCNAGALATAGEGTALAVIFGAHKRGRGFKVYADETRPLLQGGRLTAWELERAGVDVTVICDNMAGALMKEGKITAVITGADRIAANGDTANKIGTYGLSILAREHGIAFYVAAPSSTFDLSIKSGAEIPIEQRGADEVRFFAGRQVAASGAKIYNPAFDVTEAGDITAIITEKGVIERPDSAKIAEHLGK